MDDEIYLSDIFLILWKNRLMIIGIFAIFVLVGGVVSFAIMQPTYRSSAIVALGNFGDSIYTNQDSAMVIMQSDEYLLEVVEELNFEVPPEKFTAFEESIEIELVKGTSNLLVISAETKEREEGKEIVETLVRLFAERSEESFNKRKDILSDELASTRKRLETIEMDINQTRDVLKDLENAPGVSTTENEMRISRTLDYLNNEESRLSSLLDRELELQKQLTLFRHQEVIQEAKTPVTPLASKNILIIAIAGMLGLMIGILAAFLREGLRRPVRR